MYYYSLQIKNGIQNKTKNKDLVTEVTTKIERSFKRPELKTQRINRELLYRFGSKTNKCTQ
jgi:hypothetical protein